MPPQPEWGRLYFHSHGDVKQSPPSGFTVLEIIAVICIILILAAFVIPNYDKFIARAQEAVCTANMRAIHGGIGRYLEDNRLVWPQGPLPHQQGWANFWVTTLAPYGIKKDTWECPTIQTMRRQMGETNFTLSYYPATFDTRPNIAYRWTGQPWLMEIADAHGKGPLICFPDGSIKPFLKVLAEQGIRLE